MQEEYARKRENRLLNMTYDEQLRHIREEAEKNIFSQIFDRIKKLLLKVCHLYIPC